MSQRFAGLRVFIRWGLLLRAHWIPLGRVAALAVLVGLIAGVGPFLAKLLIDNVYPSGDTSLLNLLVLGVAAIGGVTALLGALRAFYVQVIDAEIGGATRLRFVNHLQHLALGFHEQHRTGELLARVDDVRTAQRFTTSVFATVLMAVVYAVVVPIAIVAIDPRLAMVAFVVVPIPLMVQAISAKVLGRRWKTHTETAAQLQAVETEFLSNIRSVKAAGGERHVFDQLRGFVHQTLHTQLSASSAGILFGMTTGVLRTAGMAFLTWYAWGLILGGTLTLGDYFAFTAYLTLLSVPMQQLAGVVSEFQRAKISLARMFEYLDVVPEQDPSRVLYPAPAFVRRLEGAIRLEGISVRYQPGHAVLVDVSCDFAAGSVSAVLGPSGAGKSTLLKVIGRFVEPTDGALRFDGSLGSSLLLEELRAQISVMWQEGSLFRGTVWENLTFGCALPDRRRVERAVSICQLDSFLSELSGGYETPVGEMGATLSAGQRQRILIARALVKEAPILLLDEPTSNLDVDTEHEILRALISERSGRTIVIVSHRQAAAEMADCVVRLDGGRMLAAEGSESIAHSWPLVVSGEHVADPVASRLPRPWGGLQ